MIFDSLVTSSLGGLQTQNELLSSHGIASDEFQQKVVAQGISVQKSNFYIQAELKQVYMFIIQHNHNYLVQCNKKMSRNFFRIINHHAGLAITTCNKQIPLNCFILKQTNTFKIYHTHIHNLQRHAYCVWSDWCRRTFLSAGIFKSFKTLIYS